MKYVRRAKYTAADYDPANGQYLESHFSMFREKLKPTTQPSDDTPRLQQITRELGSFMQPRSIVYQKTRYVEFLRRVKLVHCLLGQRIVMRVALRDLAVDFEENLVILKILRQKQEKLCSTLLRMIDLLIEFEQLAAEEVKSIKDPGTLQRTRDMIDRLREMIAIYTVGKPDFNLRLELCRAELRRELRESEQKLHDISQELLLFRIDTTHYYKTCLETGPRYEKMIADAQNIEALKSIFVKIKADRNNKVLELQRKLDSFQ